ncbi:MAG: hypothetical protein PVI78_03910 [Anaerolineales bacterium]
MNKTRAALPLVFVISLSCVFTAPSWKRIEHTLNFDKQFWLAEESRLEALGCDMTSEKVSEYRQCLFDAILRDDETGLTGPFSGYQHECREYFNAIPGCVDLPDNGSTTFVCDVSREAEGTYNDEYCPLGHSVELNIVLDWETREFTYEFNATCIDATWSMVYDFKREAVDETWGGGVVTERGWLLGEYHGTTTWTYECGPPRYCGDAGSPPEDDVSGYSRYVVGKLASMSHLEMGFQNQNHPMDLQTLGGFNTWQELENASRGNKIYDCYASN